jgi:nucleoside-diphosphate-sugar epimerase
MKLFVFGLGYSATTLVAEHGEAFARVSGTVRSEEKASRLRAAGIDAHVWNGGAPAPALVRVLTGAETLLVSAAPDDAGDPMLRGLGTVLETAASLEVVVYWSTIGVYGDYGGAWIDEDAPLSSTSERGRRRILAEAEWAAFGAARGIAVQQHRLAGIYGPGRNAILDLRAGTARRIVKPGQVFNRIHVSDIAGAAAAGLARPDLSGAFNICDDEPAAPQDVVAHAAGLIGAPVPPDLPFETATLSEMARSFYADSKRCSNRRMREVLGYRPRFPTYREGLASLID